uniref:F-box domain-containing protein n=1 Tax=Mycena chlorophos TaxID=658473 RepID=A0ABQ0L243_MYCCL|nr:predicted protein [Mycena chlorophos]
MAIAKHCPLLHALSINVGASTVPSLLDTVSGPHRTLQQNLLEIDFNYSPIEDPMSVAKFLTGLFSGLQHTSSSWWEDDAVAQAGAAAWEKVEELLPHLHEVRLQERLWARDEGLR